jgi:phosphatidylglycerophosphatase A
MSPPHPTFAVQMPMSAKTDAPASGDPQPAARSSLAGPRKPRVALAIATSLGLGYMPVAPGTWGSLAGIVLAMLPWWVFFVVGVVSKDTTIRDVTILGSGKFDPFLSSQICLSVMLVLIGVRTADRTSKFLGVKDPSCVVIDEVSGQHLTLLLGCAVPVWWRPPSPEWFGFTPGLITQNSPLSWKYLLLGLILFRVFDIWKPAPARQAESLPGGLGIMADDWIAGIYAAIVLWIARAAGL